MNSTNDIKICSLYMSLVDRAISESWWLVKRILGRMKIVNVNGYRFGLPQNS